MKKKLLLVLAAILFVLFLIFAFFLWSAGSTSKPPINNFEILTSEQKEAEPWRWELQKAGFDLPNLPETLSFDNTEYQPVLGKVIPVFSFSTPSKETLSIFVSPNDIFQSYFLPKVSQNETEIQSSQEGLQKIITPEFSFYFESNEFFTAVYSIEQTPVNEILLNFIEIPPQIDNPELKDQVIEEQIEQEQEAVQQLLQKSRSLQETAQKEQERKEKIIQETLGSGSPKTVSPAPKTITSYYEIKGDDIFYKDQKIQNIDLSSFEALSTYFAKDKNHIFFEGKPQKKFSEPFYIINELNPKLVFSKDKLYSKESSEKEFSIYSETEVSSSFQPLLSQEGTSCRNLFFDDSLLYEYSFADNALSTLGSIIPNNLIATDSTCNILKNNTTIYLLTRDKNFQKTVLTIQSADPNTFIPKPLFGIGFYQDKDSIYYNDHRLDNLDPLTTTKDQNILKDKENIYIYSPQEVQKVTRFITDPTSFKSTAKNIQYFTDKYYVYYFDGKISSKITKLDPISFEFVGENYVKDKKAVYYIAQFPRPDQSSLNNFFIPIKGVNPLTFKKIMLYKSHFFADDTQVVENGKILEGTDPKSYQEENILKGSKFEGF